MSRESEEVLRARDDLEQWVVDMQIATCRAMTSGAGLPSSSARSRVDRLIEAVRASGTSAGSAARGATDTTPFPTPKVEGPANGE